MTDIAEVSKIAREFGVPHCCDVTFATPIMVRPIELGCDMSLHSTTKYFDGHNMTVGGCISSATKEIDDKLHFTQNVHGNIMTPQTAFTTLQPHTQRQTSTHLAAKKKEKRAGSFACSRKQSRIFGGGFSSFLARRVTLYDVYVGAARRCTCAASSRRRRR